ncbi:MAG TPA: HupE/UreJ family protein [Verrucomicrobiae bacterium]|nr:HupE/UreJ family protein [Verrucomicrobiae bacterium]
MTNERASWYRRLALLSVFMIPAVASAHPGLPGHTHGFLYGVAHPLSGLDHLLAMLAVGVWAAQRGGRSLWTMPLAFVAAMTAGGMLGMAGTGITVPWLDQIVAATVLVLGICIAGALRVPVPGATALVGLFALFHGYAHGADLPMTATALDYGLGFMLATVLLLAGGIGIGRAAQRAAAPALVRYTGAAIAVAGLYCLINA